MESLFNVGSGVVANYISTELLQGLTKLKDDGELQKFKADLLVWCLMFEATHDGTIASRNEFAEYVKNYRIVESVTNYVLFPEEKSLTEQSFLSNMLDDMIQGIENKLLHELSPEDKEVIFIFLKELFNKTKDFISHRLPDQQKILLYKLCQHEAWDAQMESYIQKHFDITEEKLSQLLMVFDKTDIPDISQLPQEFEQIILNCNRSLRESQKKVQVYTSDDLNFNDVYVPPSFDIVTRDKDDAWYLDNRFLYQKSKHNLPIEERWKQIDTIFNTSNIIYVVGGAGYGKSLFLKNLCVNPQRLAGFNDEPRLIIRGDLKRMIQSDGMFKPMLQYLEECLVHTCLQKPDELYPNFLNLCLKAGRCLILLDALDEVANDQRNELHYQIITFFQHLGNSNKVCITSRDRGFIPDNQSTICFIINPITIQNVGEYVDNFISLGKFPPNERDHFINQASNLVDKGFVTGFLTLSLLLAIYKNEQELPFNKISLYEKCFDYIANSRERLKLLLRNSSTGEKYDWDVLNKLMSEATFMHLARLSTPNNRDISQEEIYDLIANLYKTRFQYPAKCKDATDMFLQFCSDRTEVLVPSPNSNLEYRFFHRSIYEFFYSNYLVQTVKNPKVVFKRLYDFSVDSEIFELIVALYYKKNPISLRKLLQHSFEQVEKKLKFMFKRKTEETLDILIMLMQYTDENDFVKRFIKLFMTQWNSISLWSINSSPTQIRTVFKKDVNYYIELYQKNQRFYDLKITQGIIYYLLLNQSFYNVLLEAKDYTSSSLEWKSTFGFNYAQLLSLHPNWFTKMEHIFNNLKEPRAICKTFEIPNEGSTQLSAFANQVCLCSQEDRKRIYLSVLTLI